MLIMIDKGPDFLIGLAHHPEWATSYTHVADVVPEDMFVVDSLMQSPLRTESWGSINATVPIKPFSFTLERLPRE